MSLVLHYIHRYRLSVVVFICGAVVMILELVAARILAPHVGTSLYVWASLIGVILGSLSIGYWLGGKYADSHASSTKLSLLIFLAALFIVLIPFLDNFLLQIVYVTITDIRVSSIIACLVLFCAPTVFLGMVSPYALRLSVQSLNKTGSVSGKLYALSTLGSIVGTFLTGFVLITYFPNTIILYLSAALLLVISVFLQFSEFLAERIVILAVCIVLSFAFGLLFQNKNIVANLDTYYSHVTIYDGVYNNKPTRFLLLGDETNSAMYLGNSDLVYPYTKFYRLSDYFVPAVSKALMIGGGAYSYPKDFLQTHKSASLDVIEIDGNLSDLAKKYFAVPSSKRLTAYTQDGRTFLNRTNKSYQVIFNDAFNSHYTVPYQLTTKEAVQQMYDHLSPNGVVITNVISSLLGSKSRFFAAEFQTYRSVFPKVYVFPVQTKNPDVVQNIMLVAVKKDIFSLTSSNPELENYLRHVWKGRINAEPILTDDYAPVDQYMLSLF